MIKLMRRLVWLFPEMRRPLSVAAAFKAVETLFMGMPYGIMILVLNDLLVGKLTTKRVIVYTLGTAFGYLGQGLFCWLFTKKAYPLGTQLCKRVRLRIGEHLRNLPMCAFSHKTAGNLAALVSEELTMLTLLPRMAFPQFISSLIFPIVLAPFLLSIDWRLALTALIPVPLAFPVLQQCRRELSKGVRQRNEAMTKVSSLVVQYVQGMEVVKGFRLAVTQFHSFAAALERSRKDNLSLVFRSTPLLMTFQFILDIGIVLLMILGAVLLLNGSISIFVWLTFLILALRMYEPIKALGPVYEITQSAEATLDRIEAILSEKPQVHGCRTLAPGPVDINFKNVSFAYDDNAVLRNISLEIPAQKVTAIVGPSGSGKTTMLRLIARFWDVDGGEICLGGVPVRELSSEALFGALSMVFQDVYLFQGTVRENIAFGSPDASDADVERAARAAHCHDFIDRLPQGYDTPVGEGGATLSGGERQRIAIARALLKDAPVVLLDEATASVDPENECQIQEAIDALVGSKTVVLVAHRLTTITQAEQIAVLDGLGNIAAIGSHEELLKSCFLYQRLWKHRKSSLSWKVGEAEAVAVDSE
ncbi:ABC transporter ATP-binding protein [Desulfobulbus oralis]|nr:ABC transporter ATP-binding protein [Desulfobulbus oralis]